MLVPYVPGLYRVISSSGKEGRGREEQTWLAHLADVPLEPALDRVLVDKEAILVWVRSEVVADLFLHRRTRREEYEYKARAEETGTVERPTHLVADGEVHTG